MWISNENEYEELYRRLSRYVRDHFNNLNVHYLPETESTNSWVKDNLDGVITWEDSNIVFTRHQTAGRGTHNRRWVQQAGLDVAITLEMGHGDKPPDPRTTLAAGAVIARAIESLCGCPVGLKWPNDLMLQLDDQSGGRWVKVGGILVETFKGVLIIGTGINCNSRTQHFPPELCNVATTLRDATGSEQDVCRVIEVLFHALVKLRDAIWNEDIDDLLAEWKTRNCTGGTRYLLARDGVTRGVTAVDVVFPDGWLNVVDDAGNEYIVISHSELSAPGE